MQQNIMRKMPKIFSPSAPIRPSLSSSAALRKALVSLSVRTRAAGLNLWRKNLVHTEAEVKAGATHSSAHSWTQL